MDRYERGVSSVSCPRTLRHVASQRFKPAKALPSETTLSPAKETEHQKSEMTATRQTQALIDGELLLEDSQTILRSFQHMTAHVCTSQPQKNILQTDHMGWEFALTIPHSGRIISHCN